mgnify:CR=1 FL=1
MQEPKSDKDEEFCKKVNDYLNNPPAPGGSGGGSGSRSSGGSGGIPGLDLSNLGDSELQSLLNNMSQSQLMQLFGGGGSAIPGGGLGSTRQRSNAGGNSSTSASTTAASTGSSSTATTTTTTSSNSVGGAGTSTKPAGETSAANIQLSDQQNVLSELPASGSNVDLSSGLTSEVLAPLLENPEFVKKMKELLPDEEQQQDDIGSQVQSTLHSPQFRQALGMFSSGLQTGQLAPLIREFNLSDAAMTATEKGDLEAFIKALQNSKNSPVKESGDKKDKKDKNNAMLQLNIYF